MGMYRSFAAVYDRFMDDVPYEKWGAWLVRELRRRGIEDGLIAELGCGTGTMTEILAGAGYDMIGIDASADMLGIAQEKKQESGADILYLEQDMRSFELYGTVRAVVSVCDSVNYILNEEDLLQVFRLVNNYLDPGGVFIFDMNTPWKYARKMGDRTFAENREGCSFIWENTFYEEEQINEYGLTLFVEEEDGSYRRFNETHYQKAYEEETVLGLLAQAGLAPEAVLDAYTDRAPGPRCGRLVYIAKETRKAAALKDAAESGGKR